MRTPTGIHALQGAPGWALPLFFSRRCAKAWTVLELIITISVASVLLFLFFSLGSQFIARASDAGCKANLRTLHAGLSTYMQDHSLVWPQVPDSILDEESEESDKEAEWWFNLLKDYDVPKKTWICPGDNDRKKILESEDLHVSTYSITQFDDVPNTAYRWKQPWAIEDGDMHGKGKGPNMIFPDGSIQKGMSLMSPE